MPGGVGGGGGGGEGDMLHNGYWYLLQQLSDDVENDIDNMAVTHQHAAD